MVAVVDRENWRERLDDRREGIAAHREQWREQVADRSPTSGIDWRGYAVFVAKWYAVLLSVIWLLVAGLLAAGYVVGPAPTVDAASAPAVDFDEPPSEIAADAHAQFRVRDHTVEHRLLHVQGSDPTVLGDPAGSPRGDHPVPPHESTRIAGGVLSRTAVNYSTERVRIRTYPTILHEGYTEADAPHVGLQASRFGRWGRWGPNGSWSRTIQTWEDPPRNFSPYTSGEHPSVQSGLPGVDPADLRRSEASIHRENGTTMVIEFTAGPALDRFSGSLAWDLLSGGNATSERLLVVVRKGPVPHVARMEYTARGPSTLVRHSLLVSHVDATGVPHPDRTPPTAATGGVARAVAGVERILGWIGLV